MKKMLVVLSALLLALCICPAAAEDGEKVIGPLPPIPAPWVEDCETCTEPLIEPVPHDRIVKWILQGKYGESRLSLLSSFVKSLKSDPVSFYMYVVSFDAGGHGTGVMHDASIFSGTPNPTWTVSQNGFSAEEGYVFDGWMIYENQVFPGEQIVLTEYNTKAAALWKAA